MVNKPHYTPEQFVDFLEGHLDTLTSNELLKHLKSDCRDCNNSITVFKRMLSAIQALHWNAPSANAHKKVIQAYSEKYPVKTRTRLFPLLRPALIGLITLVLIAFVFLFNLTPRVVYAGYIKNVTGQVEMLDSSSGSWNSVTAGQSLPVNASIRSSEKSKAVILFPGGEQTTLGEESEVHLIALSKSHGTWEISLEQVTGLTDNQTSQNTRIFSVTSPAGVVNSSNSHFLLNIASDGSLVASVLEGEVQAISQNQQSIIHSGETSIFTAVKPTQETPIIPDDPTKTALIPYLESSLTPSSTPEPTLTPSLTPEPSLTPTPSIKPTKPINPTKTPDYENPQQTPIQSEELSTSSSPGNSGEAGTNSNNSDVNCSPGNSNGAGNSENANNSGNACK